jgi:hypothetical protein
MGIDGVGKPGAGFPPVSVGAVGGGRGTEADGSFRVEPGASVEPAGGSDALDQLTRGELSLNEYLDLRVAEATLHLEGKLPTDQLEFVKDSLREQLGTDPVLVELVRRSTGSVPAE